ncbi:hypothetical protein BH09BAC4_BH09BAC4_42280 [soil metagenome]
MNSFLQMPVCRGADFMRLKRRHWQFVLLLLGCLANGVTRAQTFKTGNSSAKLLSITDLTSNAAPSLGDTDADGDLDATVGTASGKVLYFKNIGTSNNPIYSQQTGSSNPYNSADVNPNAAPSLGDIDADGDLDAIVGTIGGTLIFLKNVGTAVNPIYSQQTGSSNPFEGQGNDENPNAAPTLGDIDADGDLDAVIGTANGNLLYYQNVGTATNPIYSQQTGSANPFGGLAPNLRASANANFSPSLGDMDGDGDLDAIVGTAEGTILFFKNVGTAINPIYSQQTGSTNPFGGQGNGIDLNASPSLGDTDGDGDLDAIIGTANGKFLYLKNMGSSSNPIYSQQSGSSNPFHYDLVPILYTSPNTVYGISNVAVVVKVAEINGIASTGFVSLYIAKDPMLPLSFDPNVTSIIGYPGSVENNQWNFDGESNSAYYILTSKVPIEGQQILSVGLTGQLNPGGTRGQLTISAMVLQGSEDEANTSNNSDADKIDYFNK